MPFTLSEQQFCVNLAHNAIEAAVRNQPFTFPEQVPQQISEKRGAFVTIKNHGALRGCIGFTEPEYALFQTIIHAAQSAALRDPRFQSIQVAELPSLTVEISVMTPMRKIRTIDDIQPGIHGLFVQRGSHRGLLLPQVAVENNWDRTSFLEHTCIKAGLYPDVWKEPDTEISIFSCDIIKETS